MAILESRTYQLGDEFGIVELYNNITGRCRTIEQHRWEWLETPNGIGSIWVITESGSGVVVGHHGLIPIKLDYFGKIYLIGKTENTILHPKYLGTGIYFIFEKKFLQAEEDSFDLLYTTFANGTPAKIRKKLGYEVVGKYITYTKVIKSTYIKQKIASLIENNIANNGLKIFLETISHLLSYPLTLFFSKKGKIDENLRITKLDNIGSFFEEIDNFWDRNKAKFGITVNRSSEYLKWRIFENPNIKYEFLVATHIGRVIGYVITKLSKSEVNSAAVVDLVCEQNDEVLFNSLLNAAVSRLINANVCSVSFTTLDSKNFLNKCLPKNGFLPIRRKASCIRKRFNSDTSSEGLVLLAKVINKNMDIKKILNADYWYYTDLFNEGID